MRGEEIGLKIEKLEDDKKLQDLALTVHHAYMHTFSMSVAIKIIENHIGVAIVHISAMQQVFRAAPGQAFLQMPDRQAPGPMQPPATRDATAPGRRCGIRRFVALGLVTFAWSDGTRRLKTAARLAIPAIMRSANRRNPSVGVIKTIGGVLSWAFL